MRDTTKELAAWLESGGSRIGQVVIARRADGWELRHEADAGRLDLTMEEGAAAARALANLDDSGAYRPLKTAPNLRRGWLLIARSVPEVRKALDAFYPAMIGVWLAHRAGELIPVNLRETLDRQTGMYRITQKITDDQAQGLIARTCEPHAGCIKTILWQIAPGVPITGLPKQKFIAPPGHALPLWCHEACNLLVARARKVVKGEAEGS
jgi:sirohydrochlorin cobaltochelatase